MAKIDDAYILRRIKSMIAIHSRYNRPGEGSYLITLECGHKKIRKFSEVPTQRMRCHECFEALLTRKQRQPDARRPGV